MLQADKNEALKKALFRGDVSLIEELLNSGEEKSLIKLNIFSWSQQKFQFSFKKRLYILTGIIHMFLHALNTLFWKIKLLFQWLIQYSSTFLLIYVSFVNQETWKLRKLCLNYEITCFFVFRYIFNMQIAIRSTELEVI